MPHLVFELGAEEMPAVAVGPAIEQLRAAVEAGLAEARLGASSVRAWGTPRRLVALAEGVPAMQPDLEREVRGPAKAVAFGPDGKPTGAAVGFARKQGVPVEDLRIIATEQGEYVAATVIDRGKPAVEATGPILSKAVAGLTFPKLMRWGTRTLKFVRPIRWILALLDEEVVRLEFAGTASGRRTRGHRFLAPDEVEIATAADLLPALRAGFVMLDPEERRTAIRQAADALAAAEGGRVVWDEDLLEENVFLVEWPTPLYGRIADRFLALPRPVLVTAMKKHQRFFPVEDSSGALLPGFISVRSGGSDRIDNVRSGNERVLTARFNDAEHFHQADSGRSLDDMAGGLGRLMLHEKLGTIAQKRERLEALVGALIDAGAPAGVDRATAVRAASLCKADLTSAMVIELPALQGVMGREYALASGEPAALADAIAEHYRPKSAGDDLPPSALGRLLAVADRLDTLVGYVGLGILPSGSGDPFGLRRAAQGVVQILADEPEMPALVEMQVLAAEGYARVNGLDLALDPLCNDLSTLFGGRLAAALQERGVRYDLVEAALSGGFVYSTLVCGAVRRAETVQVLAGRADFVPAVQAAARCANILRSAESAAPFMPGQHGIHGSLARSVERALAVLETECRRVDPALLVEAAEADLHRAALAALPEVARCAATYAYEPLFEALRGLQAPVTRFFDDVMVMVEDEALRRNRLALLSLVDSLYKTLADFTRVVIAG